MVEVAVVLVLEGLVLEAVVLWFMSLEEVVPVAPVPVLAVLEPMLLVPVAEEAVLLPLQESEIMLTDVTCNAPPLDCVPCTST